MNELETWREVAPCWTRHAPRIAAMTRDMTAALVDRLAPRPGERVLDVAAGAGDPATSLAAAVGPAGLVVAADPVETMVARLVEERSGPGAPRAVCCPAAPLPFPDGVFHGVTCRFGAMFFDDVAGALAEMGRVLAPGGRLVLAVWAAPRANPYFTVTSGALDDALGPVEEEEPPRKGVFEWSRPGALARHVSAAGFREVDDVEVEARMRLPDTPPRDFFEAQAELSGRVAERAAALDPEARARVAARVADEVSAFADRDGLALPARLRLVTGLR